MYLGALAQNDSPNVDPNKLKESATVELPSKIPDSLKQQIISQAKQAARDAVQNVRDSLGRKFFESSVYKNLGDIVSELQQKGNVLEKLIKQGMMVQAKGGVLRALPGGMSNQKMFGNANIINSNVARFILGKYPDIKGKRIEPIFTWLKKYNVLPSSVISQIRQQQKIGGWVNKLHYSANYSQNQLMFLANDLAREAINLERELNRVHLPMPGDLRKWAFRLRDLASSDRSSGKIPDPVQMVILWLHMNDFKNWMNKIKSSLKEAELRSENLKKKQMQEAEKAYSAALENARAKYLEDLKNKNEEAKKEATQNASEKAKEETKNKSYEEQQKAISDAVQNALQKQSDEYQKKVAKITGDLNKYEMLTKKLAAQKAAELKRQQESTSTDSTPVHTMPVDTGKSELATGHKKTSIVPLAVAGGALLMMLGGG